MLTLSLNNTIALQFFSSNTQHVDPFIACSEAGPAGTVLLLVA